MGSRILSSFLHNKQLSKPIRSEVLVLLALSVFFPKQAAQQFHYMCQGLKKVHFLWVYMFLPKNLS